MAGFRRLDLGSQSRREIDRKRPLFEGAADRHLEVDRGSSLNWILDLFGPRYHSRQPSVSPAKQVKEFRFLAQIGSLSIALMILLRSPRVPRNFGTPNSPWAC